MADEKHFCLESFVFNQVLNSLTFQRSINEIVKFSNDGERDEIENDVDCVVCSADHENICELDSKAGRCLQKTTKPGKLVIIESVVMIDAEFHHAHASKDFVHRSQMQNNCANESCEHYVTAHWCQNNQVVLTVKSYFDKGEHDQSQLQNESNHCMHYNIYTLGLQNFVNSLLADQI